MFHSSKRIQIILRILLTEYIVRFSFMKMIHFSIYIRDKITIYESLDNSIQFLEILIGLSSTVCLNRSYHLMSSKMDNFEINLKFVEIKLYRSIGLL